MEGDISVDKPSKILDIDAVSAKLTTEYDKHKLRELIDKYVPKSLITTEMTNVPTGDQNKIHNKAKNSSLLSSPNHLLDS